MSKSDPMRVSPLTGKRGARSVRPTAKLPTTVILGFDPRMMPAYGRWLMADGNSLSAIRYQPFAIC
jgi:hypothetical protein